MHRLAQHQVGEQNTTQYVSWPTCKKEQSTLSTPPNHQALLELSAAAKATCTSQAPGETVYNVGQVVAGIQQNPGACIGHTIQVRRAIIAPAWVHPTQSGLSGWDCGGSTGPCLLDPARGFGSVHALPVPGPVPTHPNSSPSADPIYPHWSARRYHVALALTVPK
jgi:hypothetical protein